MPSWLASVWSSIAFRGSNNAHIGEEDKASLRTRNAPSVFDVQVNSTEGFVSSYSGAAILAKFGTNRRKKLESPKNWRTSLGVLGTGKSTIAFILRSPGRMPSLLNS